MALVTCHECTNPVSTEAAACPKCGAAVRKPVASAPVEPTQHRKVSALLAVGIVFMPYIFAWILLRPGYSSGARIVGFAWAAVIAIPLITGIAHPPAGTSSVATASVASARSPQEVRKEADAVLEQQAENQIRKMLKDEGSAVFRNSYGWIKHGQRVACGEVNSKNSFGAMAGYSHWLVLYERDTALLESAENRSSFANKWNQFCSGDEDPVDTETDPSRIALRVLHKAEHPCLSVTSAQMSGDNSIHAICSNGEDYQLKLNGGVYVAFRCSVSNKYHLAAC